eukprot:5074728-Pyramimonas_sp.AAC.1
MVESLFRRLQTIEFAHSERAREQEREWGTEGSSVWRSRCPSQARPRARRGRAGGVAGQGPAEGKGGAGGRSHQGEHKQGRQWVTAARRSST